MRKARARLPTGVLHCHNRFREKFIRNTLRHNGIHLGIASAAPHDYGRA